MVQRRPPPPPLLIDPDGTARLLDTPADLLVGLDPDTPRTDHQAVLEPGSTVLLYPDGPVDQLCDTLLDQVIDDAEGDIALLALRIAAVR